MAQSLSVVYLHLVFSTKERRPYLRDIQLRSEVHAWLGGASGRLDCPPILVGGVDDHVHILSRLGRTISQADWVKELKRSSTLWIKERDPKLGDFKWQSGYGVFSVSESNKDSVIEYIAQQELHHKKWSFQDEYRLFLKKHGQPCDERYVWD